MEQAIVDSVQLGGSVDKDLSIMGLFIAADPVVKAVMLGLIVVSIFSWTVIFDKILKLRGLRAHVRAFEDSFWSGGSIEELYDRIGNNPHDPMSLVFSEAMREWRNSKDLARKSEEARGSLRARIQQIMNLTIDREMERLEKNMSFLASVGSTAPFVGLFGTVWGIMNSFKSIAIAQNTNLAVVAPGIAEALFATALGLFVAIPAVVAYNKISNDLSKYFISLETFMDEFSTIFFRQLEKK